MNIVMMNKILIILIIIAICLLYYVNNPDYLSIKYHEIFPVFMNDIRLNKDISKEKNYKMIMDNSPRELTNEELIYLLKYKKFMDIDGVYSMCGPEEINQTKILVEDVIKKNVPGCIIEMGVWKGGMTMWIQAILNSLHTTRNIYLFDVFGEFPRSSNPKDKFIHSIVSMLFQNNPTVKNVQNNFQKLNLWDDNIIFVAGDIMKTVPGMNLHSIAILRCDCDYYDCTKVILEKYYWRINKGGYIIIDDYNNSYVACRDAVDDFRKRYGIKNKIIDTHGGSVYWKV